MVDSPRKPFAYVRLTPAQKTRLSACLSFTGQTEQSFCQAAILQQIEATETDREQRAESKRKRGAADAAKIGGGLFSQNPGQGGASRKAEAETWAPPAPVVVNVGSGGDDAIAIRLAAFVNAKPAHEKDRAKRQVADAIAVIGNTREEQEALRRLVDGKLGQKPESLLERIGRAIL